MAFYKYGLAFLAGTGFGAAMTTLRNSRCPLHRHDSCSCHRRHRLVGGAGGSPAETGREMEEYYDAQEESKKGKRCPKKGGKEKKGDKSEESSD